MIGTKTFQDYHVTFLVSPNEQRFKGNEVLKGNGLALLANLTYKGTTVTDIEFC
jgi:hypothetical protein